ncbi:MAG: hypothetical protein IPK69_10020 [Phycisphaerales bacterium]|nr:MAG: hypothetical protein IPK69_10020 [Phycisphaerales bacterium]
MMGPSNAIERFFGGEAMEGPFALLGIAPESCTEGSIIRALETRLSMLAAHPEGATGEAHEVRLALHAAAAQLLESAPAMSGPTVGESAVDVREAAQRRMDHAVIATLAQFGGWNRSSLHRLLLVAQTVGVSAPELMGSIQRLATGLAVPAVQGVRSAASAPAHANPATYAAPSSSHRSSMHTAPPHQRSDATALQPSTGDLGSDVQVSQPRPTAFAEMGGAVPTPPIPLDEVYPEELEQADPVRSMLMVAGVLLVAVVVVAVGVVVYLSSMRGGSTARSTGTTPIDGTTAADSTSSSSTNATKPKEYFPTSTPKTTPSTESSAPSEDASRQTMDGLVREIQAIRSELETDTEAAVARLARVCERAGRVWVRSPLDRSIAVQSAIIESLYRVSDRRELCVRVIDSALQPLDRLSAASSATGAASVLTADDVLPAIWACGLGARLSRERDLPTWVMGEIRSRMGGPGLAGLHVREGSFQAGAIAAMAIVSARLVPSGETIEGRSSEVTLAYDQWLMGLDALGLSPLEHDRVALTAMEQLMRGPKEPTLSKGVFDAIGRLARASSWSAGQGARTSLIRWFDDATISEADLHAVTSSLLDFASGDGFDVSMVLGASAGPIARAEVRDRLRTAWGLDPGKGRQELIDAWLARAPGVIGADTTLNPKLSETLDRAATLSRLSADAALAWAGETISTKSGDPTQIQLSGSPSGAWAGTSVSYTLRLNAPTGSGPWLVQYQSTRDPRVRGELLASYAPSSDALAEAEARVIVDDALKGNSALRQAATRVVARNSGHPAFVLACLDATALAPLTRDNANFFERMSRTLLPAPRDPSFRAMARRGLVERLLELSAGSDELQGVDAQAMALAASARSRTETAMGIRPVKPSVSGATPTANDPIPLSVEPADQAADALVAAWRLEADRHTPTGVEALSIRDIEARASARLRLAEGPAQRYAAHQVTIAELLAYTISIERPGDSGAIRDVLDDLGVSRRTATHVVEQILAGELAHARLWQVRLGGAPSSMAQAGGPSGSGAGVTYVLGMNGPDAAVQPATPASADASADTTPRSATSNPTPETSPEDGTAAPAPAPPRRLITSAFDEVEREAITPWAGRLGELSPSEARGYFLLAEEVADAAGDDVGTRRLAIRLYTLAFTHADDSPAGRELAASACLGLADVSGRVAHTRWLSALARSLDARHQPILIPRGETDFSEDGLGYRLASLIGLIRSGEGIQARRILQDAEVRSTLMRLDRLLRDSDFPGGVRWFDREARAWPCTECANDRVVRRARPGGDGFDTRLCPICNGLPGPTLSTRQLASHLRFESWLLHGDQRSWSAQLSVDHGEVLLDPDPREVPKVFEVEPTLDVFRDGWWTCEAR